MGSWSASDGRLLRPERRGVAWWLAVLVCKPALLAVRKADWRRVDLIPGSGGAVVAANHVSHIDPLLMAEMLLAHGRVPRFLAKNALFRVPIVGWWFRAAGHVEVDRDAGRGAYDDAVRAARAGRLLLVYPEASITRRPDGMPMSMKSGAVRIALEASVPLVPVAQWGAQSILPAYSRRLHVGRRRRVVIAVGDPIRLDDLTDLDMPSAVRIGLGRLEEALASMVRELSAESARSS